MEDSDAALVARVRAGDARAADRPLPGRYFRACRAVALAVTGNEADADDACQDGFVAAIEQIDSCRNPARFGGWLLQIVRQPGPQSGSASRLFWSLSRWSNTRCPEECPQP